MRARPPERILAKNKKNARAKLHREGQDREIEQEIAEHELDPASVPAQYRGKAAAGRAPPKRKATAGGGGQRSGGGAPPRTPRGEAEEYAEAGERPSKRPAGRAQAPSRPVAHDVRNAP